MSNTSQLGDFNCMCNLCINRTNEKSIYWRLYLRRNCYVINNVLVYYI